MSSINTRPFASEPAETGAIFSLYQRPEWRNVDFGRRFQSNFSLLGKNIILSQPRGYAELADVKQSIALNHRVISEVLPEGAPYVQIEDYRNLSGASLEARRYLINDVKARQNLLAGILCTHSPFFKLAFKIGARIYLRNLNIQLTGNLSAAIEAARRVLVENDRISGDTSGNVADFPISVISRDEWAIDLGDYGMRLEVIDGDILHALPYGNLQKKHVAPIFKLQKQVFDEVELGAGPYYLLSDAKNLKNVSFGGRREFRTGLRNWYRSHPFECVIFYNANWMLRAAINLSKTTAPYNVYIVDDFEAAKKLIAREKAKQAIFGDGTESQASLPPSENVRQYVDDLLKILADINWEALDHEKIAQSLPPFHPFHPVAEALSLIKMDFDQLLNERDISEKQLRESRERYKNILASIEEGYYESDIDGNLTFYNAALKLMLGYTDKELTGINYLRVADESNAEDIHKTFNTVFKTRKPARVPDWRLRRKDGATIYIEASVSAITDEAGKVSGFRGIIRDITEKVEARIEKEKLEKRLQQSQKMEAVGTLAGGVAHDLNNILSGIVSYPDLLLMKIPADSSLRKSIETIKKSGERASAVVQDLLTLAQKGLPESRIENLNLIVEEYLSSPEHERLLQEHPNVRVEACLDDNLLNMSASSIHILKMIMNLVANAAEAMPAGGQISISSENVYVAPGDKEYPEFKAGEYVKLVVADDGIGISPEDQERIFEPFYTKKIMGRSGSGLGMAMVWGAVRDHSGHIDVQSALDKGTRISILLPACRTGIAEPEIDQSIEHLAGSGESVLVVDDVAEQRELVDQMLSQLGYRVTLSASGEAAVAYLKDHPADLVILDMIMEPGMDGLDTYKAILDLYPSQKTIIATGYATSDRIQAAEALGVKQCVKKPFLMADLARAVRAELDAGGAGKENPGKKFEF